MTPRPVRREVWLVRFPFVSFVVFVVQRTHLSPRSTRRETDGTQINTDVFAFYQRPSACICGFNSKELQEPKVKTATVDIGTLIACTSDMRKGRPRIAGTEVTVRRIVTWYKIGLSPEEITAEVPHLTLAQVHAALAYYHANRDEIELALAADEMDARFHLAETRAKWSDK